MSIFRRIGTWLGVDARSAPKPNLEPRRTPPGDSAVSRRMRELAEVDWPGRDTMCDIGQLEGELRTVARGLTRLEVAGGAMADPARATRKRIDGTIDDASPLVRLAEGWPNNWSNSEWRFHGMVVELRRLIHDGQTTIEAAKEADECRKTFEMLRRKHRPTQPALFQQITSELGLDELLPSLQSANAVKSCAHRLSLVGAVLMENELLLQTALVALVEGIEQSRDGPYLPTTSIVEAEVAGLRKWIPERSEERIALAGKCVSATCTRQLDRLIQPTKRSLRAGIRDSLGMEPVGPILYWARLHHSKQQPIIRSLNKGRKRAGP